MDLSKYSDAELEAIAGGNKSTTTSEKPANDLSKYSDAELEAIASGKPTKSAYKPMSMGDAAIQGLENPFGIAPGTTGALQGGFNEYQRFMEEHGQDLSKYPTLHAILGGIYSTARNAAPVREGLGIPKDEAAEKQLKTEEINKAYNDHPIAYGAGKTLSEAPTYAAASAIAEGAGLLNGVQKVAPIVRKVPIVGKAVSLASKLSKFPGIMPNVTVPLSGLGISAVKNKAEGPPEGQNKYETKINQEWLKSKAQKVVGTKYERKFTGDEQSDAVRHHVLEQTDPEYQKLMQEK